MKALQACNPPCLGRAKLLKLCGYSNRSQGCRGACRGLRTATPLLAVLVGHAKRDLACCRLMTRPFMNAREVAHPSA